MEFSEKKIIRFAHALADAAAAETVPVFGEHMSFDDKHENGGFDPVTTADRNAEHVMRDLIIKQFPDHGVIGEEYGERKGNSSYRWILDPIDGTRAYVAGIPVWGTLIAFSEILQPVIGVIDHPVMNQRFTGWRDGAEMNGTEIHTRTGVDLSHALMCTTTPDMFHSAATRASYGRLERAVRMRRFGTDCFGYGLLATGRIDLVVEGDLKIYDIQAVIPVIEGAGGVITDWNGQPAHEGGYIVAAGDAALHEQALNALNS